MPKHITDDPKTLTGRWVVGTGLLSLGLARRPNRKLLIYRLRYSDLRWNCGSDVTKMPRFLKIVSSTEPRIVVV